MKTTAKPKSLKPSQVLRKAKKLIRSPKKWTTGLFFNDGCMCAKGAILAAVGYDEDTINLDDSDYIAASDILAKATCRVVKNKCSSCYGSVVHYNDAPKRTHKQIMKLFDIAIKLAEKNEC